MTGSPEGSPIGAPLGTIVLVWLQIGRPSRHGQEEDTKKRDRADHGAHGGHYLGG